MQLKLSAKYIIAFILLFIVMMEAHEIVHITVGRIICGDWGARDFNVWQLCDNCSSIHPFWWLSTLAGPLFSFGMMWLGMLLLNSADNTCRQFGFAFIFSNIPFGRITTVMMGGGDEMVVVKQLMKTHYSRSQMILTGSVIVLLLGVPPVVKAYKALVNKRPWLYITGFLTLPLLFFLCYVIFGLNTLLTNGFLTYPLIMGTPLLITIHTITAFILLMIFLKNLVTCK